MVIRNWFCNLVRQKHDDCRMNTATTPTNPATNMKDALSWLSSIIASRLNVHSGNSPAIEFPALEYIDDGSWLPQFIAQHEPSLEELTILMLALAPELDPNFYGKIMQDHLPEGGDFADFGGVKGTNHRGILPTGETAQFVLAGHDLDRRLFVRSLLSSEHWLSKNHILWLESVREGEPAMSGRLVLDSEIVEEITTGKVGHPRFNAEFPAEHIETEMNWDDLVLNPNIASQIREIENWITHSNTMLHEWGLKKKFKPGYRALFYGPPGTGKTLTATLLGKHTGKDVFRIDLSRVVSKYIGETGKNLASIFDKAEHKNWILFFDEADAIFGKRTDVRDSHDKYANQEVAYLLQRIESFSGIVILASNQRANIDDAFVRRLQNVIHFPMPGPQERHEIWRKTFPSQIILASDIDWWQIAARHELTGASIINVTQHCAIDLLANKSPHLDLKALESAIMREFVKEGRIV
jgi:AAA+ superfamily predicted ATPase